MFASREKDSLPLSEIYGDIQRLKTIFKWLLIGLLAGIVIVLTRGNVSVTIPSDLPAVYGDRQRLVEVMQNLIDNTATFMGYRPNLHREIANLHVNAFWSSI